VVLIAPAGAQEAGDSLAKIEADYHKQRAELDRERVKRLTRLAASQKGGDAEQTYAEIFRSAIASDHYADAEPAAEALLRSGAAGPEALFLARLVRIIAEAERGDHEGSMRDLRTYVAAPDEPGPAPAEGKKARAVLTIGEAYFRRLVHGGRFDLAREVCDLVAARVADPAVRDHFAAYRRRLDLVGRPAPAIRGADADGEPVRLDDLKGKVVLVSFWATWCPPSVDRLPGLNRALEDHGKKGFAVIGVDLDTGPGREAAVRKFVVDYAVPWPNVLSREGDGDLARAYAVTEIPANVLIGRDGRVVTFDLAGPELDEAVTRALAAAP
jgi:thiol-disulfide isomerase/thioredoxin